MIDNSYLLGLFGGTSTFSSGGLSGTSALATRKAQPTPPWSSGAVVPEQDALVRSALGGRRLIDENAAKLDVASASDDYRRLFALYQGLESLNALANRAGVKGVSSTELSLITKRFDQGLKEISSYVASAPLTDVRLVAGVTESISKTSAGVRRDSAISVTSPIHEGDIASPVTAFEGDVVFDINVKRLNDTHTVRIDLSEMGGAPRTLGSVTAHINDKLQAAGLETRIGRERQAAEVRTLQVGGRTVTLPAGPDLWSLAIRGVSTEAVSFSAPDPSDAVYVVQGTGTTGAHEVLKFQADTATAATQASARVGETQWVDGRVSQTPLPEGIKTVRASATGPDGALWLVADMEEGPGNLPIKGQSDVALIRLDSAGRVVSTRALGAADQASGYALAVDDAGRVAVAGSVTGALIPGKSGDVAGEVDSFVTLYDGDGEELWTQRRGARAADEATGVAFGPDGQVIVTGRAKSAMPGAAGIGGWDSYVQTITSSQPYPTAAWDAKIDGTLQFGTTGDDAVQATAVSGDSLYTAGEEDGRLIVRRFQLSAGGEPQLLSTRDLGAMSGSVKGLQVDQGQVIVAGVTRNAALDVGTVNQAHNGGLDAFVAVLSEDLTASGAERLTYIGTENEDALSDVKLLDGKLWMTGTSARSVSTKEDDPVQGYLSRVDPLTGTVEWTRSWAGQNEQAAPLTLAVASGGSSVLDRLGLPSGEIVQSESKKLVDATALRVGDRFSVVPASGGRAVAVTIDARDTLQTLARKIEIASGSRLKVTVASESATAENAREGLNSVLAGVQRLSIMARDGREGAILVSGEPGRDALAGLGLSAGFIGPTATKDGPRTFGLDLPQALSLSTKEARTASGERLQAAMKAVRDAYRSLAPTSTSNATSGPVPAYLTAQLANYQAALSRLGG
ncbi:MAG: transcriptional regulator [Brevundimonas sp.]|uniref:transcriptional regulator n=1 Tax=Brevundimonas sp. TaxID=1871086 RepID=UPI002AB93E0F|nr:transcriptional regulator [Brevundimonas sp.]MDZ4112117.1 transcriptional regulator [Brevundimonas sp.]